MLSDVAWSPAGLLRAMARPAVRATGLVETEAGFNRACWPVCSNRVNCTPIVVPFATEKFAWG